MDSGQFTVAGTARCTARPVRFVDGNEPTNRPIRIGRGARRLSGTLSGSRTGTLTVTRPPDRVHLGIEFLLHVARGH